MPLRNYALLLVALCLTFLARTTLGETLGQTPAEARGDVQVLDCEALSCSSVLPTRPRW